MQLPNQPDHDHSQDNLLDPKEGKEGEVVGEQEGAAKDEKPQEDDDFVLTPEQEELVADLKVEKKALRPAPWEPLSVPPDFKAKLEVYWKPDTGPAIDAINDTVTRMMPNVSWPALIEEWKQAVVLPTDTVLADLRIIGTEDIPLLPGVRIGHGGLLLTEREEKGGVSYVLHMCIPQRTDIFEVEDDWKVQEEESTTYNRNPGQLSVTKEKKVDLEAQGHFHAERWIMDDAVSLNCDGNVYFAMCESTLSGRGRLHLKVKQSVTMTETQGLRPTIPDTYEAVVSTCCCAAWFSCCSSCCSCCDCKCCQCQCCKCDCTCCKCPTCKCPTCCPPTCCFECDCSCDCCRCFSCFRACSCTTVKYNITKGMMGDIIGPDSKTSRAYQQEMKEQALSKMYLESYMFDHDIDKNRTVHLNPPSGYETKTAIEAKGHHNALTMQRHILHLGYRGLHDDEPTMGRIYLAAKQDRRMMQRVMSVLASHLVPIPKGYKLEKIEEQPRTFTAPSPIPTKALGLRKGFALFEMNGGQQEKSPQEAEETDGATEEAGEKPADGGTTPKSPKKRSQDDLQVDDA